MCCQSHSATSQKTWFLIDISVKSPKLARCEWDLEFEWQIRALKSCPVNPALRMTYWHQSLHRSCWRRQCGSNSVLDPRLETWNGWKPIEHVILYMCCVACCRARWPCNLRRKTEDNSFLGSRVRIPPSVWIFFLVFLLRFVGRGLCNGLITPPE